jgi:mRNA-degrading endonuclease RelE of RelBE toxin-antitoxin system
MDKITKALLKLSAKERAEIKGILEQIKNNSWSGFDLKKLKNHSDIYRLRKGQMRIIFRVKNSGEVMILALERRSDNTYNGY